MQVCAVTVAFDNPNELAQLLCSLQTQEGLNGLIVVDNSRDVCVNENEAIFSTHSGSYPLARYVCATENTGSAAGFSRGMRIAHEEGFDWVWLLDQDGTVENGCLGSLLKNAERADILCPKIVYIGRPSVVAPQSGAVQNIWGRMVWNGFTESRDLSFFATHGALISKKVLDRIGYYDAHHYFVGSEDSDYAFRATSAGMVIRLIVEAEARHPDIFGRSVEKKTGMIDKGMIDTVYSERGAVEVRSWPRPLMRLASLISPPVANMLPEHLGYVSNKLVEDKKCRKNRALASLSYAYLATKRLTTLQLGIAFCYSLLSVTLRKMISSSRINLKKTVKMYSICMQSKLRRSWPFESVERFCESLCE
jgi:rhamnopyranosyl-N-acetylglucosaminyl-diphospho-decaprenol beta-1,3/1,4-galactofuranosyltransferase